MKWINFTKKAQGATELLIVLAVGLAILLVFIALNFDVLTSSERQLRYRQARAVVDDLADAAELVYQQGVGSKTRVYVSMPGSVETVTASNRTIAVKFSNSDDTVYRTLEFDVNGIISGDEGSYWFCLESTEDGICTMSSCSVCGNSITEGNEECDEIDLDDEVCSTRGYDYGNLSCSSDCTFDLAECKNLPDTTPPSSITNLDNQSSGTSWIFWNWTNPGDSDFSQAIIFVNGTNEANTTDNFYNATGLTQGSDYIINVHTIDTNGNVNDTDVVDTVSPLTPGGEDDGGCASYATILAYYDSGSGNKPLFRIWNGTDWSAENTSNSVGGKDKHYYVLESSSNRTETILAVQDANKDINVQIWNGTVWDGLTEFSSDCGVVDTRTMDIAYEQTSGDALFAFVDNNDQEVPRYALWDGSSWSAEANALSLGGDDIKWTLLEAKPNSDEIILINLDGDESIWTQVWDGSSWGNKLRLESDTDEEDYQQFDIAYEQSSGEAMVVWVDEDSNKPRYRTWDGDSWSSEAAANSVGSTEIYWIKLAAKPDSDEIAMVTLDSGRDLNAQIWDGSSWGSNTEIDSNIETRSERAYDLVYESQTKDLLLAYGDRNDDVPVYYTYDGSWSSANDALDVGADPKWVVLAADSTSDEIFMMIADSSSDISIQRWDGGSWSGYRELESQSVKNEQAFDIAYGGDCS